MTAAEEDQSFKVYCQRYPDQPTPLRVAEALFNSIDKDREAINEILKWAGQVNKFIHEMNEKNMERNQRLDALEQRIAALEATPHVV